MPRFYESVDADPLFAAEGLDLENAENILQDLERTLASLEKALSKGDFLLKLFFVRYPLSRYAVPVPFLGSLLKAERERRRFLAEQTREKADRLIEIWERTARALLRSVRRYQKLHRVAHGVEREHKEKFEDHFGNSFTLQDADQTLLLLEQNAQTLLKEVASRKKILEGGEFIAEAQRKKSPIPDVQIGALSPGQQRLHALDEREGGPFRGTDIIEKYGPLRYTLPHFDGVPTEHLFFVYFLRCRDTGRITLHVSLADEFYFLPIGGRDKKDYGRVGKSLFNPLLEEGIPYWYQHATYFYTTRDVSYWADLATMVDHRRRPYLRPDLLAAQHSSLLDLIISASIDDIHWYEEAVRVRAHVDKKQSHSGLFGLLVRSHPSLYFLSFNKSVWRLAQNPKFVNFTPASKASRNYLPSASIVPALSQDGLERVMSGARLRKEIWKRKGIL